MPDPKYLGWYALEWSKKLTIFDNITFLVMCTIVLLILLFQPTLAQYCGSMLATFATVFVTLRLGYSAKSGIENYLKIGKSMRETIAESAQTFPTMEEIEIPPEYTEPEEGDNG